MNTKLNLIPILFNKTTPGDHQYLTHYVKYGAANSLNLIFP